jgi:hypothetical protein
MITTLTQLGRDISSTGKSGLTTYTFVALPRDGGYQRFARPDQLGGIVTSRAGFSMRAEDRRSSTEVEIDLPEGALVKTVQKHQRGGSDIEVEVVRDGALCAVKYIGARKNGGGWDTVIEIDGRRITVEG